MVNRRVRRELLTKLGITHQALSQRAQTIKRNHGPMSTDDAVYVIAHLERIDISKYLPLSEVDRVRLLVPPAMSQKPPITSAAVKRKINRKKGNYSLVSPKTEMEAYSIGENNYPKIFILENSIRELIIKRLAPQGVNWWNNIPGDVKKNVERTMNKEKRYPQRQKRGNHPIFYANFDDLKKIIIDPKLWIEFQLVLLDRDWVRVKMDEVYMARNSIAHCVIVTDEDIDRINLFFNEWFRLLANAGIM